MNSNQDFINEQRNQLEQRRIGIMQDTLDMIAEDLYGEFGFATLTTEEAMVVLDHFILNYKDNM